MSYGRVLFGLALLSPVLFQSIAVAQPAPQAFDNEAAFTPRTKRGESLVALGRFKRVTETNLPKLTLEVDKHVYEIVKSRNGKIKMAYASRLRAPVSELLECSEVADGPCRIEQISGDVIQVIRDKSPRGRYAVVSESIANEFPIFTHWKQALNKRRGGRQIGGTDAVAGKAGGEDNPTFYDTTRRAERSPSQSPPSQSPPSQSPLWSTSNSLFSTDIKPSNAELPAYERYPGENYSLFGLSDLRAEQISYRWASDTGFSARHLNGRDGCRAADVIPQVPFFQVVHACPIGEGDKMSLATLVIPPNWNRSERYPVLLYPDRDLHFSFHDYGEIIGSAIGQAMNSRKGSAIGVVWNAGAGFGSAGLQRSMYANATRLFDLLKTSFSADTDKIITVGCSRGGSEALAIAGNPYPHSYTVMEVVAYSPDVAYGTRYSQFTSPTYPALMIYNHGIYTGYKHAWREEWREMQTGYRGWEVVLKNTFDTVRPNDADELSPISDKFLSATKKAGTRITLSIDTHDQYMPFANYVTYVNKARSEPYGIPMHVRIHYRGEHCANMNQRKTVGPEATLLNDSVAALARVSTGDSTGEGTFWREIEYYSPGRVEWVQIHQQPVAISLPRYVTPNGTFLYSVSGSPGVNFKLEVLNMNGKPILPYFSGQLPPMDPGAPLQISTYTKRLKWPTSVPVGSYYYQLSYSVGNTEGKAPYVPGNSEPLGRARFEVTDKEPMKSSKDFCNTFDEFARIRGMDTRESCSKRGGWGLSSDSPDGQAPAVSPPRKP